MIITVTLNPALDLFYTLSPNFAAQQYWGAGGKGINVSRALHGLGRSTIALGCAGETSGKSLRKLLRQEDICHELITTKAETRTNITVTPPSGKTFRIMEEGNALSSAEIQKIKKLLLKYLPSSSVVVLSGRLPPGIGNSLYAELIALVQKRGALCFLDTHGLAFEKGLKAKPFFIKPNREEAEALLGKKMNSPAKLKGAVNYFLSLGIKKVIISLGEEGAVGSEGNGVWQALPPRLKAGHTVGCGDAFVAGFLTAHGAASSFPLALQMGVAAGTANLLSKAPGQIKLRDVKNILPQVRLKV